MIPSSILSMWFSGLLSVGILGGAIYLLREWFQRVRYYDPRLDRHIVNFDFGANEPTALLLGGIFLLLWAIAGSVVIRLMLRLGSRKSTDDSPSRTRDGETERIRRPDGSELCVERHGRKSGPTLLFTHGWGTDSAEWSSVRRDLGRQFQILLWDLPGLGLSGKSATCKPEASERIARDVPGAQLALLASGSHLGFIERGDRFVELVEKFAEACFHPSEEQKRAQA